MENDFHLFSTLRVERGQCTLLTTHLERLEASAAALGFQMDRPALEAALQSAAGQAAQIPAAKLRLQLSRDGHWQLSVPEPLFADAPDLKALLWPEPVNSADPMLPHKTTRRPVYDRVVREVHACGFVDAIFHNERGQVTEGAVHSVFARWGEAWKAPTRSAGILPGVFREHLLATKQDLREEDFTVEELLRADEVWLTNALRGIRKVTVVQQ